MNILVITDLEGVGGVLNFSDWCLPEGIRNEAGCRFLTEEVNAVVQGFFDAGADAITVWDGHGSGGSLRAEIMDQRVSIQRGTADWPSFGAGYDAMAFVGQHAMAGSRKAHLAHTQTEECVWFKINGNAVGEYGQQVLTGMESGIPVIFVSGDEAMAEEARLLTPAVTAVAVKKGLCDAPADASVSAEALFSTESAAVHYPRIKVHKALRDGAFDALKKFQKEPEVFRVSGDWKAPFTAEAYYRSTAPRIIPLVGDLPERMIRTNPRSTITEAIREFYAEREWAKSNNKGSEK